MSSSLQIDSLGVRYSSGTEAVQGLSLDLAAGQIACLLGPSGCGKSSLLRAIAGFVQPHVGRILLGGRVLVHAPSVALVPEQRGVGMVFQDYALFPHLTVLQNVIFGLTEGRPARAGTEQLERGHELLELTGLSALKDRFPHELSGGQAQRVALARALAPRPALILLDEPFSSLDHSLRVRLAREVRDILKASGTTAIMVTHDQTEAFAMGDVLGVMFDGRLVQWDSPYAVYHEPCTPEVAQFIGEGALISGTQRGHEVNTPLGVLPLAPCCCNSADAPKEVRVLLRPDDIVHDDASPLQAQVLAKRFRGADFLYTLRLNNGEEVLSLVPSHHDHPMNAPIGIRLEADHVVTFRDTQVAPAAFSNDQAA
jgi:iron(III) transport system ATP-binding protein